VNVVIAEYLIELKHCPKDTGLLPTVTATIVWTV